MKIYQKDFDTWNQLKKNINATDRGIFFYENEIWWTSIGANVGYEQDGKGDAFARPVFICKKINDFMFLGIPLTRVLKEDAAHVPFYFNYDFNTAIISQISMYDRRRLIRRMGSVSEYLSLKIKKAVRTFIG